MGIARPPTRRALAVAATVAGAFLSACGDAKEGTGSFSLRAQGFGHGGAIPARHAREGGNVSPGLEWSGAPAGAKEFLVVVDDPDAEGQSPAVHWVVYGIPEGTTSLPEGVAPQSAADRGLATTFTQGRNSFDVHGWTGPDPPAGRRHTYQFWVYALDSRLPLPPGATKQQALESAQNHVIGTGRFVARYEKPAAPR
jgi:Raf kinase inhibitor-like YbhB/YbcL family protein